jgi:hypothetical protein
MYQPPAEPRRSAFETLMLTITGMSALAILAIIVIPLILCVGLSAFCLLAGIGASHVPTPTPFP